MQGVVRERVGISLHGSPSFLYRPFLDAESPMSQFENPYAAQPHPVTPGGPQLPHGGSTILTQLAVVGGLQIALGVLEMVMGAILLGFAFFMRQFMQNMAARDPAAVERMPPEMEFWMQVGYMIVGGAVMLIGLARIPTGIATFWYRGRFLMVASLLAGLLSIFTCYCAVLSLPLAIYGCIIMFHPVTAYVYQLRAQGASLEEIKRAVAAAG
jgi:hypothetical protein